MPDRDDARMRELTYRLVRMAPPAPPFPEEPVTQLTPTPPPRRPAYVWAAIAAAIVLVAIGIPALLSLGGDDDLVAATTTQAPADTTEAPVTSQAPETTAVPDTEAPTTEAPLNLIDLSGLTWVRSDAAAQTVVASDGSTLVDLPQQLTNLKIVAWDGGDGVVLLTEAGELRWLRPEADTTVPLDVLGGEIGSVDDVVLIDGRPVAALRSWGGEAAWVDVETGDAVDGDPTRVEYFEEWGLQLGSQGRTVRVEYPENADAERDETGALIWPFDLPELVVSDASGAELARIEMGSEQQPWVRLHDFDGRRVVVSVEPMEPAFPPTTVYVIDLESAGTEVVELPGADTLDLVGILESAGPVATEFDL